MVFPQEANDKNLKLKVDYTLTNAKTGETIKVYGATAEVPFEYLQWKANFSYTYIFKISDNTNGKTKLPDGVNPGSPEGLYPITFDAAVIVAEDGQAEYITTVSEPSITTFGVKAGKYVHGGADYEVGSDIYATIVQNSAVEDPTGKYRVLTVTPGATEAQVAETIAEAAIGRLTGTPTVTCTPYTTGVTVVTTVPGEDGIDITSTHAIKMQAPAANTYAVEYKAADGSATATTDDYSATATYYSMTPNALGFYPVVTTIPADDLNAAGTNWLNDEAKAKYTKAPTQPVYVYKIIKVVAP